MNSTTPFDEPPISRVQRSVPVITPPPIQHHDMFWSPNDKYTSGDEDSDELDIRNVSAFDEWDGDNTVDGVGQHNHHHHHDQRNVDDIHRVLSFDDVVYNDDGNGNDQCHDELMWSISLSSRCHKSLQALFLPSSTRFKEEQSLTSTQVTKVISNKKQKTRLPNIRKLTLSPASDTITGATLDCSSSMYTKNSSDKSNDDSNNSSSSWNSLWCCGVSQSYPDDSSLEHIQRRLFSTASLKLAPPIPDVVLVMMKQDVCSSSEHLLRQLDNDEDKSTSITVFEDDDSFWSV